MAPTCSIEGCDRPRKCRGWCHTHYIRWHRHGDPLHVKAIHGDDTRRFWSKVQKTDTCWIWQGFRNRKRGGYGTIKIGRTNVQAHRFSYEERHGPVPLGFELDHLCRNPVCVRPDHLEPVPHAENVRRGSRLITHCPQGHAYTEANTYRDPRGTHGRQCRTCIRERARRRRH